MEKISLELRPDELAGVIEALYDGILRRLRWSVYTDNDFKLWKSLELSIVQQVIDNFISAYSNAVMVYRDAGFRNADKFENLFVFKDEVWSLLADITTAETWDDIPKHAVHSPESCDVCCAVFSS